MEVTGKEEARQEWKGGSGRDDTGRRDATGWGSRGLEHHGKERLGRDRMSDGKGGAESLYIHLDAIFRTTYDREVYI